MSHTTIRRSVLLCLLLLGAGRLCGQPAGLEEAKRLLAGLNPGLLSYRYRLRLVQQESGRTKDSLEGVFYVQGSKYLDSNRHYLKMSDGRYALHLDFDGRTTYLKNVAEFRAALKGAPSGAEGGNDFSAWLDREVVALTSDRLSDGSTVFRLRFGGGSFYSLDVYKSGGGGVTRLVLTTLETDLAQKAWYRVLDMDQFSAAFGPEVLSSKRFLSAAPGKVALAGRYRDFSLVQLHAR